MNFQTSCWKKSLVTLMTTRKNPDVFARVGTTLLEVLQSSFYSRTLFWTLPRIFKTIQICKVKSCHCGWRNTDTVVQQQQVMILPTCFSTTFSPLCSNLAELNWMSVVPSLMCEHSTSNTAMINTQTLGRLSNDSMYITSVKTNNWEYVQSLQHFTSSLTHMGCK